MTIAAVALGWAVTEDELFARYLVVTVEGHRAGFSNAQIERYAAATVALGIGDDAAAHLLDVAGRLGVAGLLALLERDPADVFQILNDTRACDALLRLSLSGVADRIFEAAS